MPGYGADPRVTAWPVRPLTYGRGYLDARHQPDPGAGSSQVIKVPGDRNWRLWSIFTTFTASATVANRTPRLRVLDADFNVIMFFPASVTVAASTTTQVQFFTGAGTAYQGGDGSLVVPVPDLFLPVGWQISIGAVNIQAGDTVSNTFSIMEAFPNGSTGYENTVVNVPAAEVE